MLQNWSDLHTDLLEEVARKLIDIDDFTAFRGVCSSWRAIRFKPVSKVPHLIFPANDSCEIYSLRKRKISSRLRLLPEATCTISVGFGWILVVADELSFLMNPRSAAKIQLPCMELGVENAVVSANPSETWDFMLMVSVYRTLGFWRNGDKEWSTIQVDMYIQDICYYKHKLYAINGFRQKLGMCDPYNLNQSFESMSIGGLRGKRLLLVESSKGELLLIQVLPNHNCNCFQIDPVKKELKEIQSLDGDAIYIDQCSAKSVAAADILGVFKPNCIYILATSDSRRPRLRIYNVQLKVLVHEGLGVHHYDGFKWTPQWLL